MVEMERLRREERRPVVAVIGSSRPSAAAALVAEQLGELIIERGWRLVTGGLGGIMEAASRGAHRASAYREGLVLGFLPGYETAAANPWVDIAVPTGMGHARNVLVVAAADAVVAVAVSAGTLSEMAIAWQLGRPIIEVADGGHSPSFAGQTWDDTRLDSIWPADNAAQAVEKVRELLSRHRACEQIRATD